MANALSQMVGSFSFFLTCCCYLPQIINNVLTKTQGGLHVGFLLLDGFGNLGALCAAWGLRFPAISYIVAAVPLFFIMVMLCQRVVYRGHDEEGRADGEDEQCGIADPPPLLLPEREEGEGAVDHAEDLTEERGENIRPYLPPPSPRHPEDGAGTGGKKEEVVSPFSAPVTFVPTVGNVVDEGTTS